jgi:hypothetical protein
MRDSERVSEALFTQSERLTVIVTPPLKAALFRIAAERGLSASDIVRSVLLESGDEVYPGFREIYENEKRRHVKNGE